MIDRTQRGTYPRADGTGGMGSHLLVAASACALTVSIVGSVVFLSWKLWDRYQWHTRVRSFVVSLENRTPKELDEQAAALQARPALARYVMPETVKVLRRARSERQQCAAIRVSRAFLDNKAVVHALFRLHADVRESVAASAVHELAGVQPPERAAELLGRCLEKALCGAVVDEICAGLYALGEPGRLEMKRRLVELSAERRAWLIGYANAVGGAHRRAWLEMLCSDPDESVQEAAAKSAS